MILLCILLLKIRAQRGISCQCSALTLKQECLYAGCEWKINYYANVPQCIDRLPINQPDCSDYDDQLVCEFLSGCVWDKGKCEQFTQCSDYVIDQYDKSDQCYLKHHTCVKGQLNDQGFITCQSIDEFCHDLTENWIQINMQNNSLSPTNDHSAQNQVQDCIFQKNRFKECLMITNEQMCKFIKKDDETIICEWQNEKCLQVINPQLNSQQCYLQTGGTYSWQNNKCTKCQRQYFRILSDTATQPTFNQSLNMTKSSTSTELFTSVDKSYQKNCTKYIKSKTTNICYNNDCKLETKESINQKCQTFIGINYQILDNEESMINICNTNSNTLLYQNYSETNEIQQCFATITISTFIDGFKKGQLINTLEQENICQIDSIKNINPGKFDKQCKQTTNFTKLFNKEYTEICNQYTQNLIFYEGNIDQKTNITIGEQCNKLYNDNKKSQIDTSIYITGVHFQYQGEQIKQSNQISIDDRMLEQNCTSNFTKDIQITDQTDQYQNITTNVFQMDYCETYANNDPITKQVSIKNETETMIEEILTIDGNIQNDNASLILDGTILIIGNVEIQGSFLMNGRQIENNTIIESGTIFENDKILINGTLAINGAIIINGDVFMDGNVVYNETISIKGTLDLIGRMVINEINNEHNYDTIIDICPTGTIFDGINCNPIDNSDPPNQIQFNITMNDQTQNYCDNNSQCQ